jgi:hypothetical protein
MSPELHSDPEPRVQNRPSAFAHGSENGTVALTERGVFRSGVESAMGDSLRPKWATLTDRHTQMPRPNGE